MRNAIVGSLDAGELKRLAGTLENAREARAFLRDLNAAFSLPRTSGSFENTPDWKGGPRKASLTVNHSEDGEKAAQRAFFLHGEVTIGSQRYGSQRIVLLDMEFPASPGKNRIDLLGMPDGPSNERGSVRTIIELKYGKEGVSPVSALMQALAYCVDVRRHEEQLHLQARHDVSRHEVERFPHDWLPTVIVAANEAYWTNWRRVLKEQWPCLEDLSTRVAEVLGRQSWVRWARFPDLPDVQRREHPTGKYLPRVRCGDCRWEDLDFAGR